MTTISQDVASKEIQRWLDAKKVSASKRTAMADSIDALVNAVQDGNLIVSDDGTELTQILNYEVGSENPLKQLKFKLRISVDELHKRMVGSQVKSTDTDGRLRAYASALTGQSYVNIGNLDSSDYSITTTVVTFFL
jgi:hypothetical protein